MKELLMIRYQARRHPIAFGVAAIVLGPYILAFLLLLGVLLFVAALIDVIGGRR